jgi:prolyl-tRNA editing enzyme YbaK/EbsC (Cys-tRNA(Pro) deacylase)
MMQPKLPKSAASVQEALDKLGLECKVLELPNSTRTALDAASAIGCDIGQIVKSLVFRTKKTGKPVLVLASGPNQVDIKTIEDLVGERITKADADFVREVTGFAIGGIPPVGHKNVIDEIWAAAGTPNAVFCIKSQDLLKATSANIVSLSKREPES